MLFGIGNALGHSGLSGDFYPIRHGDVACKTNLPSNHAVGSDCCASRNAGLRRDDGVRTDFNVVGDLNLVVEFNSVFDDGRSQCCPVNGCGSADFASVSYGDIARLRHFVDIDPNEWGQTRTHLNQ